MKLSFVIPSYCCRECLAECIKSVQAQTMQDFECIVADDESTDGTQEMCLEMAKADPRIRLLPLRHCCAANCRNEGLDAAQGDFVWFVDADDLLIPDAARKALDFIERNQLQMAMIDGEILDCGARLFDLMHGIGYLRRKRDYGIASGAEILHRMIDMENFNCYVFLQVVRRDAIRHRFPVIALDEDLVYTVKNFMELDKVGHLNEVLYRKRCRPQSTLTSKMTFEKTISLSDAIEMLAEWTEERIGKGLISDASVGDIETLLKWNAAEIGTRYKRLDADELEKMNAVPFRRRLRLRLLAKA